MPNQDRFSRPLALLSFLIPGRMTQVGAYRKSAAGPPGVCERLFPLLPNPIPYILSAIIRDLTAGWVKKADSKTMRFHLVDRIEELEAGRKIVAAKNLTLAEEYLADHFPGFPVMPGVLMLESLVQAGAWLLRASDDFRYSIIALREVKGVKYGSFMEPGGQLRLSVEVSGSYNDGSPTVAFKGTGEQGGSAVLSARFVLHRYLLRERRPEWAAVDEQLCQNYRLQYLRLRPPSAAL